ncbi:MAG TPA: cupin domain-containing protein [Burkholderiaceae bacterium]|nr:cupin domain-containing protein [Burkholderiaceae bacterium]
MRKRSVLKALSFAGLTIAALPAPAQSVYAGDGHLMLAPSDLVWKDAPAVARGAKIAVIEGPLDKAVPFTFRLALPANARIAPHVHPAFERVTVLSGTFYFTRGDTYEPSQTQALGPGSVAVMPPGTPMFGYTKEATVIQLHGVGPWGIKYLNPADDPRQK